MSYTCQRLGPKPTCTCGAGQDAPATHHYSVRFPYSRGREEERRAARAAAGFEIPKSYIGTPREWWPVQPDLNKDCPVYRWAAGCAGQRYTYACPLVGCGFEATCCAGHGGSALASDLVGAHIASEHAP
jgi:hypothetical protein